MVPFPARMARLSPIAATAIITLASFFSCGPKEDIVVGFVASMSGIDYMLGVEGRNAAMLFVDELNAKGGVDGRKLRLEIKDIESDDANVPRVARELVDAKAVAVVGFYSSSSALNAISILREAEIPIVSPTATSQELSGKSDVFFRTIMTSANDPKVLGRLMADSGQSRVLFIAAAYNKPYYETYLRGLETRVAVVGPVLFQSLEKVDYGAIARLAKDPGYDAVMMVASSLDSGSVAQRLSLLGLSKPLYLSGWAGNDAVVTYGGSAVEGAVLAHQVDMGLARDIPLAVSYSAVFGVEPGYGAVETWDSMLFLVEGLRASKGAPGALLGALGRIREFRGATETISMDGTGDARRSLYLKAIRDGKIVVIGKAD